MNKFLGLLGGLVCLFSLMFVAAAIGDLAGGDTETSTGVLVGLLVFFGGTAFLGGYLARKKLFVSGDEAREALRGHEQTILELALAQGGRATVAGIAAKTDLTVAEAKAGLEALTRQGVAEVAFDADDDVYYQFPGL